MGELEPVRTINFVNTLLSLNLVEKFSTMHFKNLLFFVVILFYIFSGNTQTVITDKLDANSVKATVSSGPIFFNEPLTLKQGYEFPNGSNKFTVTSGSFWFGGLDSNDTLRSSFTLFENNTDLFSGPYSSNESYFDPDYANNYINKIHKVSKSQIIYHIDNYDTPNYIAPDGIKNWPGNGDPSLGVAQDLAPYVDTDLNGEYNPENGDYPCIKGDLTTYVILNDAAVPHSHSQKNADIEVHLIFYQFDTLNYLDSTTFLDVKVINRGQFAFPEFKTALYLDPSIGNPFGNYMGCDTTRNLAYAYNSESFDSGGQGSDAYENNPPAMGAVLLSHDMANFGTFFNTPPVPIVMSDEVFWRHMNSKWHDNTPFYIGGTGHGSHPDATSQTTNYIYSGNPFLGTGWSELNIDGNGTANPNDELRRFYTTAEPQAFNPGDKLEYTYAFIANMNGDYLENVQNLLGMADSVQNFYDLEIVSHNCEQLGTGISDSIVAVEEDSIPLPLRFEITRLDGEGNMALPVEMHPSSEWQIIYNYEVDSIHYALGKGPIFVERIDSLNYQEGYYTIKLLDENTDESLWRIYRYNEQGGQLLDSVKSTVDLMTADTLYFQQYGLKVSIQQHKYFCLDHVTSCTENKKIAAPIHDEMVFSDITKQWLTGVKNNNGFNPKNWIKGGIPISPSSQPSLGINNPNCYENTQQSIFNLDYYTDLVDGIVAPAYSTQYNECGMQAVQLDGNSEIPLGLYTQLVHNQQPLVFHPSIDLVFTADTNLWTRCAVIELNNDPASSEGGANPMFLREKPSVDKNGNPDNSNTYGMSWFPGYAIDVETGRRLNIAFCENSTLTNHNGSDLIWNPTSTIIDGNDNYVMGGQHAIYVFGGEFDNMPVYDGGEFLFQNLSAETYDGFRAVYRNLSWVMRPILVAGHNLLETDARVKLRINKEFKNRTLSGLNNGKPMFGFNVNSYDPTLAIGKEPTEDNSLAAELKIYPNPAQNELNVSWVTKTLRKFQCTVWMAKLYIRNAS